MLFFAFGFASQTQEIIDAGILPARPRRPLRTGLSEAMIKRYAVIRYAVGVRKNGYRLYVELGHSSDPVYPNNNR
jgi:hypothetical protein